MMNGPRFKSVDEYLKAQPAPVRRALTGLRRIITKAAPQATETISYNMPAYKLNGMLVFFAGYKTHIGFYPTPSAIVAFKKELAPYPVSKGTVRFGLDEKLPLRLISEIVKFKVAENTEQ